MDRPQTAASARPGTSSGARPTTAGFDWAQYPPNHDLPEEEYEESDDEDVFAYLPPTTADQEEQARQKEGTHDSQHLSPDSLNGDYLSASTSNPWIPNEPIFANSVPDQPPIDYPSPTFDPYARYPADSFSSQGAGPSTFNFNYILPPPQSPPSTDSNTQGDDPYRLRRLNTAATTTLSHGPTTADSHDVVRISLPGDGYETPGSEKDPEAGRRRKSKRDPSSLTDTLSINQSMIDDDASGNSIK